MAQAIKTRSTLGYDSGINKTSTGVSTNILIMVGSNPVGAVQNLNIKETRPIQMIDEVGTDGHIDSCPHGSTKISGSCQRTRFDRLRIAEAFSRGFIHVASQVYPFDIMIIDKQKSATEQQITTVIKNVWITDISYDYKAGDWIIADTMSWEAETIWSVLNGGSILSGGKPVAVGGEIGITRMGYGSGGVQNAASAIEQSVDTGSLGRRGSFDSSGIIDLGSSGIYF